MSEHEFSKKLEMPNEIKNFTPYLKRADTTSKLILRIYEAGIFIPIIIIRRQPLIAAPY